MWLKARGQVDTLCHGEVAEWLNAAVSKTVTSVIPASGVRIPPSPRFGASQPISTLRALKALALGACQHFGSGLALPRTRNRCLWEWVRLAWLPHGVVKC
jgi:hypothetical protein